MLRFLLIMSVICLDQVPLILLWIILSQLLINSFLTKSVLNIYWVKSLIFGFNHYANKYGRLTNSFLRLLFQSPVLPVSLQTTKMDSFATEVKDRSSHRRCFIKKVFLKISQYSQENTCLKACNFIKKRLQHRHFSVNIAKFLRTPILKNICKWLLL